MEWNVFRLANVKSMNSVYWNHIVDSRKTVLCNNGYNLGVNFKVTGDTRT